MNRNYFLLKTEADVYGWDHLLAQGVGRWDGVRNYVARNHLRSMKLGDYAFFYHTGKERSIVGVVEVVKEHYPDPTANGADFSCVEVKAVVALKQPIGLAQVKSDPALADMVLVRSPRLSVQPVTRSQFNHILKLSDTQLST